MSDATTAREPPARAALIAAFATHAPASVAQLLERGSGSDATRVLATLPTPTAARVVEAMAPLAAARVLTCWDPEAVHLLCEAIATPVLANLLRRNDDATRERLTNAMSRRTRKAVRTLLAFPPDRAGAQADPQALAVHPETTVQDALELVRAHPAHAFDVLFVIDADHGLRGTASLRALLLAETGAWVGAVMDPDPFRIPAGVRLDAIAKHPGWSRAHAIAVTDPHGRLVGALPYAVSQGIQGHGRPDTPTVSDTAEELASLYGVGMFALWHWATAVIRPRREKP